MGAWARTYTGACMGMPYALRAVTAHRALTIMAPLTLLGAVLASHRVENTAGHQLLAGPALTVSGQAIVLAAAFALTTVFTRARIPTSTIQILAFCVCGVALAAGAQVHGPPSARSPESGSLPHSSRSPLASC